MFIHLFFGSVPVNRITKDTSIIIKNNEKDRLQTDLLPIYRSSVYIYPEFNLPTGIENHNYHL